MPVKLFATQGSIGSIYSMVNHSKTLKVRVQDKHVPLLNSMARSVNLVWNFVNELSQRSIKERGLHSQALQCVAGKYVTRRKQFKKVRLNWRKTGGVRRSLGWVSVNSAAA